MRARETTKNKTSATQAAAAAAAAARQQEPVSTTRSLDRSAGIEARTKVPLLWKSDNTHQLLYVDLDVAKPSGYTTH